MHRIVQGRLDWSSEEPRIRRSEIRKTRFPRPIPIGTCLSCLYRFRVALPYPVRGVPCCPVAPGAGPILGVHSIARNGSVLEKEPVVVAPLTGYPSEVEVPGGVAIVGQIPQEDGLQPLPEPSETGKVLMHRGLAESRVVLPPMAENFQSVDVAGTVEMPDCGHLEVPLSGGLVIRKLV